jgi:hypothetical protein
VDIARDVQRDSSHLVRCPVIPPQFETEGIRTCQRPSGVDAPSLALNFLVRSWSRIDQGDGGGCCPEFSLTVKSKRVHCPVREPDLIHVRAWIDRQGILDPAWVAEIFEMNAWSEVPIGNTYMRWKTRLPIILALDEVAAYSWPGIHFLRFGVRSGAHNVHFRGPALPFIGQRERHASVSEKQAIVAAEASNLNLRIHMTAVLKYTGSFASCPQPRTGTSERFGRRSRPSAVPPNDSKKHSGMSKPVNESTRNERRRRLGMALRTPRVVSAGRVVPKG